MSTSNSYMLPFVISTCQHDTICKSLWSQINSGMVQTEPNIYLWKHSFESTLESHAHQTHMKISNMQVNTESHICKATCTQVHMNINQANQTCKSEVKVNLTMQSNDEINLPMQCINASTNHWVYTSHVSVSNWSAIHAPSVSVSQHAWTKQQTFGWAPMCTIQMVNN